jgi:isopenicillin N synthase-like dioxygenase
MNVQQVRYGTPGAAARFTQSLKETGFAVVADHPISAELIRNSFEEWKRFFGSKEKHALKFDPAKQTGYFPFRTENAKDSPQKDLKEFYHYYPASEWPRQVREWTPRLHAQLIALGTELLAWVDESTPEAVRRQFSIPLSKMIADSGETLLRVIHYPPLTGEEEPGALRAAAHEDINLITLLPAATAPGLQVKDVHGRWHDVPCDPGTIVVNSGDMLREASQHYYPSTTHRVLNPTGDEARLPRYSMPLFIHPRRDVRLSELVNAGEYLDQRLREIGLKPAK